ncbi:hypothetical protein IAT40_007360 [Kwoniella sp. CBS 6097]
MHGPSAAGPSNQARNFTPSSSTSSLPRNPVRLAVAQRGSSISDAEHHLGAAPRILDVGLDDGSRDEEVTVLRRAEVKRAQLIRRVERWMDQLMEETVDRGTFKKVVSHVTPPQFVEIAHERHLNSLCSYPLCANPPARPYSTARRYVISTQARTIKPTEGNEEEGYCSKKCRVRSMWIERGLSGEAVWLRSQVKEVELLEELEERGEFTWEPEEKPSRASSTMTSNPTKITTQRQHITSTQDRQKELAPAPPAEKSHSRNTNPDSAARAQPDNPVTALIARLTIHERPTPSVPPAPPSLRPATSSIASEQVSLPANTPQIEPQPFPSSKPRLSTNTVPNASPRDSRRVSSSLMATSTTQLAKSFVSATNQLGAVHLASQGGDSDDGEEEDKESDWEKEMAWGEEDDEMKALFEEARLAREMLEEE